MRGTDLANFLSPFAVLANKHAMSPIYKVLEITPDVIRGCSPWGILECVVSIGITDTIWVDAEPLIGVVKNLPGEQIEFEQSGSTLSWKCGKATGKLGLRSKMEMPSYEFAKPVGDPNIDKDFPEVLQLGSLSASKDGGISSNGMSGVALTWLDGEDIGKLYIASTDRITMSISSIPMPPASDWPDTVVISTEAAAMLGMILSKSAKSSGAHLVLEEKVVIAYAGSALKTDYRLMIRTAQPHAKDIVVVSTEYPHENAAKLPSEAVKRFIGRAAALAEAKAHAHVVLSANKEGLSLSFAEGAATSDEVYEIADFAFSENYPDIRLDALRLARALGHADMIAFDALDRHVITLFSSKEEDFFSYLINGAKPKGE